MKQGLRPSDYNPHSQKEFEKLIDEILEIEKEDRYNSNWATHSQKTDISEGFSNNQSNNSPGSIFIGHSPPADDEPEPIGHQPVQDQSAVSRDCPLCGSRNTTEATHCELCLGMLPQQQEPSPSQSMARVGDSTKCPLCGATNNPTATNCVTCHYSLY